MKHEKSLEGQFIEIPTIQFQINSTGSSLSKTQIRVLERILAGEGNKEIALKVNLSEQGIKYHVGILLKVFNAVSRADLRNKIIQMNLTSPLRSFA